MAAATDRRAIVLHEVGLRDGLQMERQVVPTAVKARWAGELVGNLLSVTVI